MLTEWLNESTLSLTNTYVLYLTFTQSKEWTVPSVAAMFFKFYCVYSGLSLQILIIEVLAELKHLLTSTPDDCNENWL